METSRGGVAAVIPVGVLAISNMVSPSLIGKLPADVKVDELAQAVRVCGWRPPGRDGV